MYANRGTTNKPPDMARKSNPTNIQITSRSVKATPIVRICSTGSISIEPTNMPAIVMPSAPIGTTPSSTFFPDILEHSKDPIAMPIEKTAINKANNTGEPFKTLFTKLGSCVKNIAPINQNHEMPTAVRKIALSSLKP